MLINSRRFNISLGMFFSSVLFCSLAFSIDTVEPETVGLSSERLNVLGQVINKAIYEDKFAGAVLLVSRFGKVAHHESYGHQNKIKNKPMQKNSLFRIYSMTKPIVSVAALILNERGKLLLTDPVHKYIPEFRDIKVFSDSSESKVSKPLRNPTIQDLLRHTSGLTYSIFGDSPVKKMYRENNTLSWDQTSDEFVKKMARIPLLHEPGTVFEYGQSTDVLARVIEVVTGKSLDVFLEENIFRPLEMKNTGYYVQEQFSERVAEQKADGNGNPRPLHRVDRVPNWIPGGHGLISTADDYWRFAQMLLGGGTFEGVRVLSPTTVSYMTSDHLGKNIDKKSLNRYSEGHGFGLGVAVRTKNGVAGWSGSAGDYYWLGIAGTNFLVSPQHGLVMIFMAQEWLTAIPNRDLMFGLIFQTITSSITN
ncbi:MAG: serine hydrolase [Proteobacteria bacterium]|nr:serine hydrolase [Pseudomonadota bacterium]